MFKNCLILATQSLAVSSKEFMDKLNHRKKKINHAGAKMRSRQFELIPLTDLSFPCAAFSCLASGGITVGCGA